MSKEMITKKQLEKQISSLKEYQSGKLQKYIEKKEAELAGMVANNQKTVPGGNPPPNPPGSGK